LAVDKFNYSPKEGLKLLYLEGIVQEGK